MKIILFIGHHKVGSTALQSYLANNSLKFLKRGILYPAVEAQGLATLLALALEGDMSPKAPLPINLREAHNALAFRMLHAAHTPPRFELPALHEGLPPTEDMLIAIRRQIEIFAPHTVILAAEAFANFAATAPALINRLARFFDGADITLTATLRQVDDYMISWQAQRLLLGQSPKSLPGGSLHRYYGRIHFDYRKMLEGWLSRMPQAGLRLRPYEKVLASGGAVQDFLQGFGILPPGEDIPAEPRLNTSLHRGVIEIARQANHSLDRAAAHEVFMTVLRLGPLLDLPKTGEIELYGAPARAEMATRFAPIHDWLGTLTDEPGPFFARAGEIGLVRPHHEYEVNMDALAQIRRRWLSEFPEPARAFMRDLTLSPNFV